MNKSSLSRVFKHFTDDDTTIVIFTSFRDEKGYEESVKTNKYFGAVLKDNKFGYFFVDGYFPENEGTEEEVQVKEDSIFAIASSNRGQNLIDLAHKLANSADQDSILVKDAKLGKIYYLDKNKKKNYISGKFKPGTIGKYYTKLRRKSSTFVFENERVADGGSKLFMDYFIKLRNKYNVYTTFREYITKHK